MSVSRKSSNEARRRVAHPPEHTGEPAPSLNGDAANGPSSGLLAEPAAYWQVRVVAVGRLSGLLWLGAAGVVLQLGWMLFWPLSYGLTHGQEFTDGYLAGRPLMADLLGRLQAGVSALLPGLGPSATEEALLDGAALAFVVAGLGYLAGLVALDRGAAAVRGALALVLGFALLFQATLLLMPGVFTTDIFSYAMYGKLAGIYAMNPYVDPPSALGDHPLLTWINPMWHGQPSVYGPLWTGVSWMLARLLAPLSLVDHVLGYKLLMNGVHLVNLALVWWLLGRLVPEDGSPRARVTAFALFAWNPLLLFEIAGNAHNDGLMVTLLLLALVPLALNGRKQQGTRGCEDRGWLAGFLFVGLSALVKYTSALVGLFYAAAWARQFSDWRRRLAWMGGAGALVLGVSLALAWPWLQLPQALQPLLDAASGSRQLNSAPDLLAVGIADHVLAPSGVETEAARVSVRGWMGAIIGLLFLGYLAWELRQVWSASAAGQSAAIQAVLQASTRGFLILILLVFTWVLPWYFAWPLAPAALLGWRNTLTRVVVAYSIICLPVFYLNKHWGAGSAGLLLALYAGLPLLLPLAGWAGPRGHMYTVAIAALAVSTLVPLHWFTSRPAPFCQPGDAPQFVMGFASLETELGWVMGEPLECEHVVSASGDSRQRTTTGLAFYRKATNTPMFTDGWRHWALTEQGLVFWTGGGMDPPPWAESWRVES